MATQANLQAYAYATTNKQVMAAPRGYNSSPNQLITTINILLL